jgi:hypothetical protein
MEAFRSQKVNTFFPELPFISTKKEYLSRGFILLQLSFHFKAISRQFPWSPEGA